MVKPVIGLSCSTLVLAGMRGVPRFALVHSYVDCVLRAGGLPLLLPNVDPDTVSAYLSRIDGLVLSGGLDVDPMHYGADPVPNLGQVDAWRDRFELSLANRAFELGMPILAICRGVQLLNVARGGTLVQDIGTEVESPLRHSQKAVQQDTYAHRVLIEPGTCLHEVAGAQEIRVNSFHHQACDRLAEGFVVSARSPDGVIEGAEAPDHPHCVGVQWHPERTPDDPVTMGLFASFLEAATRASRAGAQA